MIDTDVDGVRFQQMDLSCWRMHAVPSDDYELSPGNASRASTKSPVYFPHPLTIFIALIAFFLLVPAS